MQYRRFLRFGSEMANEGSQGPSISFPLGLALLVILLICISGFSSCCYNWNKIRSLLQPSSTPDAIQENHSHSTLPNSPIIEKQTAEQKHDESLTVVMPGDQAPKYLAFPAPRGEHQANNSAKL